MNVLGCPSCLVFFTLLEAFFPYFAIASTAIKNHAFHSVNPLRRTPSSERVQQTFSFVGVLLGTLLTLFAGVASFAPALITGPLRLLALATSSLTLATLAVFAAFFLRFVFFLRHSCSS
jgi:hypothetical protein